MTIVRHELFPSRYEAQFARLVGPSSQQIAIDDFAIAIDTDEIKNFPDYKTFNAAWEGAWQAFFDEHQDRPISQKEAFAYCHKLTKLFGIDT